MASYEKGDPNREEVAQIQRALAIKADGKFGPDMVKAVKAWQSANGHLSDGMVGPDMLAALGLTDLLIVEKGDVGPLVERIQGVVGVADDGDYGKKTFAAVREYQKQNGLKASGSADLATLRKMGLLEPAAPRAAAPRRSAPMPPPAPEPPTSVPQIAPRPASSAGPQAGTALSGPIETWAYQLADIVPEDIAALNVDLVVIDYSADGEDATAFGPKDTAFMKSRPDGGTKKLVAYMSIGEAEDYRYYWQKSWETKKTRPAWLDDLNPDWEGNYKVRYWDPAWQAIIMGSPNAYLDKIIAAGFDGVYLDIIDAFEYWRDDKEERADADKEMIRFVTKLASYARTKRPDFMIIPQNGEELLDDPAYLRVISAIGKEDIFYGENGDGKPNSKARIAECLSHLANARAAGKPILAIEYLKDQKKMADAEARLDQFGCCAYFGPRDLALIPTDQFEP
jgi:cysteinyl-tRNA synthetase